MSEHENWIRYHLLEQVIKNHKYESIDEQIEIAAKMTNFVLQNHSADVIMISNQQKE